MTALGFPGRYPSRPRRLTPCPLCGIVGAHFCAGPQAAGREGWSDAETLAATDGHPSVYDHEAEDPAPPDLPLKVQLALTALIRYVEAPGTVTRDQAQQAAAWVHAWRAGFDLDAPEPERDDCPPRGIRRLV